MCYMCLKNDPFDVSDASSSPQFKRRRIIELKRLIQEFEDFENKCIDTVEAIEALKEEQYRLSREL
jgi:hypothetical protein